MIESVDEFDKRLNHKGHRGKNTGGTRFLSARLVGFDNFGSSDLREHGSFFWRKLSHSQSAFGQHYPEQPHPVNRTGDKELHGEFEIVVRDEPALHQEKRA